MLLALLALAAGLATLRFPRLGLALALAAPLFPLGNVAQAAAVVYGLLALAWLAVSWRDPRTGLAFCAGPLLAAVGLLALLPLAVQPVARAWRRGLQAGLGVLAAAAVAGSRAGALPLADRVVGDLGLAGTERPTDVLNALGIVLGNDPRSRRPRSRSASSPSCCHGPSRAGRGASPASARCQLGARARLGAVDPRDRRRPGDVAPLRAPRGASSSWPRRPPVDGRRRARQDRKLEFDRGRRPVRMSVLRAIESKIEGLFEGIFGRAFRTHVQPVELARKLAKEMDEHRSVSVSRVYVPNEYTLYLSPADRAQFAAYEGSLVGELQEYLGEHARREGYALLTPPSVLLQTDADLAMGEFGIATRVVQREEPRPRRPPRCRPRRRRPPRR